MKKKAAAKRPTKAASTKKLATKAAAQKKPATKAASTKKKVTKRAAAKTVGGQGTAKRPTKKRAVAKRTAVTPRGGKVGTYIQFGIPLFTVGYGSQLPVSVNIRRRDNDVPVKQVSLTLKVSNRGCGPVNSDSQGYCLWRVHANLDLGPREHTLAVRFGGNGDFSSSTATARLRVYISGSKLQGETTPKAGGRFELRGILKGLSAEPVVDRRVKFLVNGSLKGTSKTDGSGIARHEHRPDAPGNKLTVEFDGDAFYKATKSTTVFF